MRVQVVDHRNRVKGVITRKDLLGHHVAHCLDGGHHGGEQLRINLAAGVAPVATTRVETSNPVPTFHDGL